MEDFKIDIDGIASPYEQAIVLKDRERSKYSFLATSMHEMGHLKSFITMHVSETNTEGGPKSEMKEIGERGAIEGEIMVFLQGGWAGTLNR